MLDSLRKQLIAEENDVMETMSCTEVEFRLFGLHIVA